MRRTLAGLAVLIMTSATSCGVDSEIKADEASAHIAGIEANLSDGCIGAPFDLARRAREVDALINDYHHHASGKDKAGIRGAGDSLMACDRQEAERLLSGTR